jgi:hypothetical protein
VEREGAVLPERYGEVRAAGADYVGFVCGRLRVRWGMMLIVLCED